MICKVFCSVKMRYTYPARDTGQCIRRESKMEYQIGERLIPCTRETALSGVRPYVSVLTFEEWEQQKDQFAMGLDIELSEQTLGDTKAEVNYDSLTGTFALPDRSDHMKPGPRFAFALDEKGIVLIDDTGYVNRTLERIAANRKWKMPGLERFLYDFLEDMIAGDVQMLDRYEKELNALEEQILRNSETATTIRINDIRGELLDLRSHYIQMMDLGQELEENENGFFDDDCLRYFRMFSERVERLQNTVLSLREYTAQLRDLMQTQIDVRQNRIMAFLTIVTTVFTPLTLITGWYGMNFRYMPELEFPWAYPAVLLLSILIVIGLLYMFRRKKWI